MFRLILPLVFPCFITAAIVSSEAGNENFRTARKDDSSHGVTKLWSNCLSHEFSEMANCFGVKAVTVLDRASRMNHIDLLPGISLVADSNEIQRSARALLTEQEIENTISAEPNEKGSKLMDMIFDSASKLFQTHSLQMRVPKSNSFELQRALDEGRAKIKKKFLPYLGVIGVKLFALLPLFLGVVGFLVLKALLVGKIALIIAALLALQKYSYAGFGGFGKLSDGFGSSASSYTPVSSPGGYYRRSIEDQMASQHLAYNAQVPQQPTHTS